MKPNPYLHTIRYRSKTTGRFIKQTSARRMKPANVISELFSKKNGKVIQVRKGFVTKVFVKGFPKPDIKPIRRKKPLPRPTIEPVLRFKKDYEIQVEPEEFEDEEDIERWEAISKEFGGLDRLDDLDTILDEMEDTDKYTEYR